MGRRRRWLCGMGAVVASVFLAGCSVDARIDVGADDMVDVDITTRFVYGSDIPIPAVSTEPDPCRELRAVRGLVVTRQELPEEKAMSCHAEGRVPLASAVFVGGGLMHAGDRYIAVLDRRLTADFAAASSGALDPASMIRLSLPGSVASADAGASVSGERVTWTPGQGLAEGGGLWAVTYPTDARGPADLALAGEAGLVLGAAAVLVVRRLGSWLWGPADAPRSD